MFLSRIQINLSNGKLKAGDLPNHAAMMDIPRSIDVNLYFSPEAKFNFEITETKTDLNLSRDLKVEGKEVLDSNYWPPPRNT